MSTQDDLMITLIALALIAGLGLFSFYRGTRPHDKLTPRLMPWMVIAFGCAATTLMLIVHLVNLLGFQTGGGIGAMIG